MSLPSINSAASAPAAHPAGPRRVTFHIGAQKTGSTSLHRHLRANTALLADCLLFRIPQPQTVMEALGRAAIAYSLSPDTVTEARLRDVIAALRAEIEGAALPVLISHENLIGAMPGNGGERALYPSAPRIVRMLDEGFHGWSVDFVLTTREMPEWLPSVWAQAVRTDGYTRDWPAFMAEVEGLPEWEDLVRRLTKAVGPERLVRLAIEGDDDRARPGGPLLAHLGLSSAQIAALAPLASAGMPRLSPASTEFLRQINGLDMNPHVRLKVVNLVASAQHLFHPDYRPSGTL